MTVNEISQRDTGDFGFDEYSVFFPYFGNNTNESKSIMIEDKLEPIIFEDKSEPIIVKNTFDSKTITSENESDPATIDNNSGSITNENNSDPTMKIKMIMNDNNPGSITNENNSSDPTTKIKMIMNESITTNKLSTITNNSNTPINNLKTTMNDSNTRTNNLSIATSESKTPINGSNTSIDDPSTSTGELKTPMNGSNIIVNDSSIIVDNQTFTMDENDNEVSTSCSPLSLLLSEDEDKKRSEYIKKICVMCHLMLPTDEFFLKFCKIHKLCYRCLYSIHDYDCYNILDMEVKKEIPSFFVMNEYGDISIDKHIDNSNMIFDDLFVPPDHVVDNIYIGSVLSSTTLNKMKEFGITHVVNAALELECNFPDDITYHKLELVDSPLQSIDAVFDKATEFIDNGNFNGKVLVHCVAGISRSASIVLAYLIRYKYMRLKHAQHFLAQRRPVVAPNHGFLGQLKKYESKCFKYIIADDDYDQSDDDINDIDGINNIDNDNSDDDNDDSNNVDNNANNCGSEYQNKKNDTPICSIKCVIL